MRLLILSFYYHPDLSAGSFRATALVAALKQYGPPDLQIDVITTQPNRYRSFSSRAAEQQSQDGVTVTRIELPEHASDMAGQAKAFMPYAKAVLASVKDRRYDMVFATSSRLMTAALGALVARRLRAPLYLDIRDIFVDTLRDVLSRPLAIGAVGVFSLVERWTMRRAKRINLVSRGFEGYFSARYPRARFAWFTNGIDDEFLQAAAAVDTARTPAKPMLVVYAGNMGEGQGLHAVIPGLAGKLAGQAKFLLIGDGGRRALLEKRLAESGATNVELRSPVNRAQLLDIYRSADVLFLHLNDYPAFDKVLPSKIFEYAAMGKPIWAGVAGYSASFLRTEVSNAAVFAPTDVEAGLRALQQLEIRDIRRDAFIEKYSRSTICRQFALDILAEVPARGTT